MKDTMAKTVDDYLAGLPAEDREALENLRKAIKAAAPQAEEAISYRMPAYKYRGALVYFAAFKDHLSLFPAGKSVATRFRRELRPFQVSGTTIHFTAANPIPASLVKKIVRFRVQENSARAEKKKRAPILYNR
jgi:uncharacterized protein YdhG (YjbR/CyaY superfamily)